MDVVTHAPASISWDQRVDFQFSEKFRLFKILIILFPFLAPKFSFLLQGHMEKLAFSERANWIIWYTCKKSCTHKTGDSSASFLRKVWHCWWWWDPCSCHSRASPGSLLEMQTPAHLRPKEPEASFYRDPQGDTGTLKFKKFCLKYGLFSKTWVHIHGKLKLL